MAEHDAPELIGLVRSPFGWRLWNKAEDQGRPATVQYVRADTLEAERSKRVRLEEALKFYAKASNWRDGILLEHIPSSVEADGGQRARSALSHSSSKGESRE